MLSIYSNTFWHTARKIAPVPPSLLNAILFPGHGNTCSNHHLKIKYKAGHKQNSYSSKWMSSIMPKCLRNLSQISKVPKQHLGPISVHKSHAFKYPFASGLGQQVHSAVVTQPSSFFYRRTMPLRSRSSDEQQQLGLGMATQQNPIISKICSIACHWCSRALHRRWTEDRERAANILALPAARNNSLQCYFRVFLSPSQTNTPFIISKMDRCGLGVLRFLDE